MDFGIITDLRELLLTAPFIHAMLSVFLAACVVGTVCSVIGSVIRSFPAMLKDVGENGGAPYDIRAESRAAWIEAPARAERARD